jgi:hypothetical protein
VSIQAAANSELAEQVNRLLRHMSLSLSCMTQFRFMILLSHFVFLTGYARLHKNAPIPGHEPCRVPVPAPAPALPSLSPDIRDELSSIDMEENRLIEQLAQLHLRKQSVLDRPPPPPPFHVDSSADEAESLEPPLKRSRLA